MQLDVSPAHHLDFHFLLVMLPRLHAQVLLWMAICTLKGHCGYAHVQTVEYLHLCMLHSESQQLISCHVHDCVESEQIVRA